MKRYKRFGIKLNSDGEFDVFTPDEMEQPAAFRQVDITVSTFEQAVEFIDSY